MRIGDVSPTRDGTAIPSRAFSIMSVRPCACDVGDGRRVYLGGALRGLALHRRRRKLVSSDRESATARADRRAWSAHGPERL
jgi:hypothetical protein